MSFGSRLKHAWNAFTGRDPTLNYNIGPGWSVRPDRIRLARGSERTIINSIYNRIGIDASSISIMHVDLDDNKRFLAPRNSGLNNCLTLEANVDQTSRAFILDTVISMLDEGCVAILPVDTDIEINDGGSFDILTMRTAKILEWYPSKVRIKAWNDRIGQFQELIVSKKSVAIIENPLYTVMNSPNSTMQRLIRKLNILDGIDEQIGANKLDMIVQLPYVIKTEARRKQAEIRKKDIEEQLAGSKYGIAYIDATEHITQLNRSVDNQLLDQIEYLTNLLLSQLGITTSILDGTADDKTMNNYYNRTIEPILAAITDEMKRKFLTKTARTQGQSICFFRDPFKLIPVSDVAEIADKFTRNEIMTSNEIRQIVGMRPSQDPQADALRNKNLSPAKGAEIVDVDGNVIGRAEGEEKNQNEQS